MLLLQTLQMVTSYKDGYLIHSDKKIYNMHKMDKQNQGQDITIQNIRGQGGRRVSVVNLAVVTNKCATCIQNVWYCRHVIYHIRSEIAIAVKYNTLHINIIVVRTQIIDYDRLIEIKI